METLVSAAVGALAVLCAVVVVPRTRLWRVLAPLPPLDERATPWLVALVGYVLGGVGIALSFRTVPDLVVGIAFLLPLGAASSGGGGLAWWYWIFAAVGALYCVLRAESANRRLEAEAAPVPGA